MSGGMDLINLFLDQKRRYEAGNINDQMNNGAISPQAALTQLSQVGGNPESSQQGAQLQANQGFLQSPEGQTLNPMLRAGIKNNGLDVKSAIAAMAQNPLAFGSSAPIASPNADGTASKPQFATGIAPKDDGRNWDFLAGQSPNMQPLIKSISEGGALPGNISRASPQAMQLMSAASQFDPSFNGDITHTERNQTIKDYATGGKSGQAIKAINQVLGHTDQLYNEIDKLNNGGNTYLNEAGNYLASNFNANGDTAKALSRFETLKKGVADEMTRAWRGTGGSEGDIQERLRPLSSANSPAQLKESLATSAGMLGSALGALGENYQRTMGPAAQSTDFTSPEAKIMLRKLRGDMITKKEQDQLDKFNQGMTGGEATSPQPNNQQAPQAQQAPEVSKTINGKTYVKRNGEWFSQ